MQWLLVSAQPVKMAHHGNCALMLVGKHLVPKTLKLNVWRLWEDVDQMPVNQSSTTAWEGKYSVS